MTTTEDFVSFDIMISWYFMVTFLEFKKSQGINPMGLRRVPAQDVLFALIIWYVSKTFYWS